MEPAPALLSPDDIDDTFVARPVPDVTEIVVGDELVVVSPSGVPSVFNPVGTVIWRCLDGEVSVGELSAELSEEFGVELDVVRADVVAFTRSLGFAGLLTGVGFPDLAEALPLEERSPTDVGEELTAFTLPDFEGRERSSIEWRGRRVLLLHWSPTCGYCTAIAPGLAELYPHLRAQGIDLLVVTSGDATANRQVFDAVGLDPEMLDKADRPHPFVGFGTPMGYLLDADGRVATTVAWGADQVLALGEELTGRRVTDNPFADRRDASAPDPAPDSATDPAPDAAHDDVGAFRYLPAPGGMCGPGGGGGPTTEWVGTAAIAVDDWHLGVRHNGEFALEVLDGVLPGMLVADPRVPDNYSLALARPTTGATQTLHLLVKGGSTLVRTRSVARAVRALLTNLAMDLGRVPDVVLHLHVAALVRDGRALLVPRWAVQPIERVQPRLARAGFQAVDTPSVLVDPETAELVVPAPSVPFDEAYLAAVDAAGSRGRELPGVLPGRYPIDTLVFDLHPEAEPTASRAWAVARLWSAVSTSRDLAAMAGALTRLVEQTTVVPVAATTSTELVAQLPAG